MALITCEDCGKGISDKAPSCPQCGAPQAAGQTATATAPPPKTEAPKDTIYHKKDRNGVEVTSTRFISGSKTYPINGITSVQVSKISPSHAGPVVIMIIGFLFLLGGLAHWGIAVGGGAILILSFIWMFTLKPKWAVAIVTAAGEVKPLIVSDLKGKGKPYVQQIADAINKAIIHRG